MQGVQEQEIGIVGGNLFGRYRKTSIEETFNMIISDGNLIDYSGYQKRIDLNLGGESRAVFRSTIFDHLIAVVGNRVYIISTNFSFSVVGILQTGAGPIFISENGANQIVICDQNFLYVYDFVANTFTQPTIGFVPIYITFQDGYFIAAQKDSIFWRLSALSNGLSWTYSDEFVGALNTKADNVIAVVRLDRQLFVMGRTTTELWRNVGASPFPYARDNTISIDYGVISADSIASGFGIIAWLGGNEASGATIMYSTGSRPEQITTDGINYRLDIINEPQYATAFLFEEDGHVFYQITFPGKKDNVTYTYDFNEKKFFTLTDENLNYHIAKKVVFFNRSHFFLSINQGSLYEMGSDFTSYDGKIIPRIRKTKNFRMPSGERFTVPETGLTIQQGDSKDEQHVFLSVSKDGGESFGNVYGKTINPLGQRRNRLRFHKLGLANDLVLQYRFESLGAFVVVNGYMRFRSGRA
jgi:hypothetical protein